MIRCEDARSLVERVMYGYVDVLYIPISKLRQLLFPYLRKSLALCSGCRASINMRHKLSAISLGNLVLADYLWTMDCFR
jgi:hypothetical protein